MVKNLDTKEIWKFSKSFVKREGILLLACVLAVASSLAVVPKAEYIDWRVLVLLYCLMLVVGGFKKRRVLDNCAVRLLQRCISLRQICLLVTWIPTCLAVALLAVFLMRQQDRQLKVSLTSVNVERGWGLIVLNLLFLLCVVTVFHWFDHWLLLMITVTVMLVLDRGLFRQIDYSLLFTFAGFFIFIGNLTQFDFLNIIRDSFFGSATGTYFSAIAVSQFISNVPAAMLLAAFSQQREALLLGVNVGGLGTLIASMASVISYKLFAEAYPAQVRHYLLMFLYYNVIGLFLLVPAVYFLMLY